jgi:tetratricopeptide (TPR) repeat protein
MANQDRFSAESGSTFTPFWRRLPSFFLYPMQMGSILRIAGYSVFGGIAMFIQNTFGGLLYFILWIVFLKYAFVVMERTANGQFDEPGGMHDKEEGDAGQVMRQFGLFLILGLLIGLFGYVFGEIGFNVGSLLIDVVIPAGIMIIAVKRSLGQALNPAQILFYIKTIGSPYLALCAFLLSLTTSSQWVQGFLYQHMDSWLALPLLSFVDFYFVLIIYHMMGYAIYQYHEELGVFAAVGFEEAEAKLSSGKGADPVLSKLGSLIANGQQDEAIDLLRGELRTRWENNDLHERYQKLLVAAGKQTEALHHAREFIAKLVTEKRLFQALDLSEQCLKVDPEFQLQDSFHVHDLAIAARMGRRSKLALDLMRRFDRRYPNHPHIPSVYFLSAQILSEHYRMDKEALQILQALQAKFPDHALVKEARQYQEALNKVAAIG